jgi:DNA-directed RNA polymerase specialized sigma24 family protein
MTFDETKDILYDIRNSKQRALSIQNRIDRLLCMSNSITRLTASYGDTVRVEGGKKYMSINDILLRVDKETEKLFRALSIAFELEDKLSAAIALLNPVEQDIIIGFYMDGDTHYKLAEKLNYSDKHIRRLKNRAIKEMSEVL